MNLEESKRRHPSTAHHVTLHIPPPSGGPFVGECSCGISSGPMISAGMVAGWEAHHRDDMREMDLAVREANDRAWELFEHLGRA